MAFKSKNGKEFTNASQAKKEDMRDEAMTSQPEPKADASESQEPSAVVAEHGPAKEVLIKHEGGSHTVKSHHEDGHKRESTHASADDAHEVGKQLAGVGNESEESDPADVSSDAGTDYGNPAAAMMG